MVHGIIFFVGGWILALNLWGAADRSFEFFMRFAPIKSNATSRTMRIVGIGWIPLGAIVLAAEFLK